MKQSTKQKQDAFMAVYEPVHEKFVRFCQARAYRVMSAEDLVNESLLRAYQQWDKIKKKDALIYFLFGTARNIVLNTIRKKREVALDAVSENALYTRNSAELKLEVEFLYKQLNKLDDLKKEALILFEISGFSIKEVAKIQNSKEGSVKMRISRARKELKRLMQEEHYLTSKQNNL